MNNIILIGMPASGKSTLGVLLAKTLGMDFIDTDLIIQNNKKMLLQEIIDNLGMDEFLQAEENAILSVNCQNTVIATGGSAVLSEKVMNHLKPLGKIIYLKVDLNLLEERLNNIESRGIACKKGESVHDIFIVRKPLYEKYSDFTIDTYNYEIEKTISNLINKFKI